MKLQTMPLPNKTKGIRDTTSSQWLNRYIRIIKWLGWMDHWMVLWGYQVWTWWKVQKLCIATIFNLTCPTPTTWTSLTIALTWEIKKWWPWMMPIGPWEIWLEVQELYALFTMKHPQLFRSFQIPKSPICRKAAEKKEKSDSKIYWGNLTIKSRQGRKPTSPNLTNSCLHHSQCKYQTWFWIYWCNC